MEQQRSEVRAYIALGSNLQDPLSQLRHACVALRRLPRTHWVAGSSIYRSPPMGPVPQPDFLNAVVVLSTALGAEELMQELLRIEAAQGRVREGERWGPRTLDLDLLLYGDARFSTGSLTLPHPGLADRDFVLVPLAEIAPDLQVPGAGVVRDLLARCHSHGLHRLSEPLVPGLGL